MAGVASSGGKVSFNGRVCIVKGTVVGGGYFNCSGDQSDQ